MGNKSNKKGKSGFDIILSQIIQVQTYKQFYEEHLKHKCLTRVSITRQDMKSTNIITLNVH